MRGPAYPAAARTMARPPLLLPAILLVAAFLVAFRLRLENAGAAPPPLVDLGAACSLALLVLALVWRPAAPKPAGFASFVWGVTRYLHK